MCARGYQSRMTDARPMEDRSLGDVTDKQLSRDISALVRSEVALAKAEVTERASVMARGVALVAVGVVFALIVISCVVAAAVAAFSLVVDVWLAALIVAAMAAVIAVIAALTGMRALRSAGPPLPLDTIESAKGCRMGEDTREIRRQVEHARDQLGDTVEELAYRANAPRRAKARMVDGLARLRARVSDR